MHHVNPRTLLVLLFTPLSSLALPTTNLTPRQNSTTYTWQTHPSIGFGPRQEHSVVSLINNIYVLGGVAYDEEQAIQTLNRVEYFDTAEQTWHVAAPLPEPINHVNAAVVDGKIYTFGALNGGYSWAAVPECYVYHPNNDTWLTQTSMENNTARGASAMGVYDSSVYIAGGMTILEPYQYGIQNSVATVSSYDTTTDAWTDLPPLPEPRQHVGGAVVGSTFYVIGGREDGIEEYHNTTYALDLEDITRGWQTRASMPTARGSLACSAIGVRIFCFGGEGNPQSWKKIFNETQVYDTMTDTWENQEVMPVPRHGTGAATVGDRVYIPGGGAETAMFPVGIVSSFGSA